MQKCTIGDLTCDEISTTKDLIEYAAIKYRNNPAVKFLSDDEVIIKSYVELRDDVDSFVHCFYSQINQKNVALIGEVSYGWIVTCYGIMSSKAVYVPVDPALNADDIVDLLHRIDAEYVFFSPKLHKKIEQLREKYSDLAKYISTEPYQGYDDIFSLKKNISKLEVGNIEINKDDLAAIVFTSGTTGRSKGVMLSHKNLCDAVIVSYYLICRQRYEAIIPILPVHHMFEFTTGIQTPIYVGVPICIGKGIKDISQSIQRFQPSILLLVPMVVDTLHKKIWNEAKNQKKDKKLKVAIKLSKLLMSLHIDIRRQLFQDIHAQFGGRLNTIVCGGAPLRKELEDEFNCFGITLLNGYGITECSPVVSCNMHKNHKSGTVGIPAPSPYCEVKNVDGEIWIKGSIVTKGYYKDEENTNKSFSNGWFKTGDIGNLNKDGYLSITGRKKNLIIMDNGENVSPEELEDKFSIVEGIKQIVVYPKITAGKQYIAAKIVLDDTISNKLEFKQVVLDELKKTNDKLTNYKRVQEFEIQEEEFITTTTGKVKRYLISEV